MHAISASPSAAGTVQCDQGPGPSAFAHRLADLRQDLYRLALSLTGDAAAADDLVQDTLAKAIAAASQFKDGTDLRAWSRTILRNAFLDGRRKRGAFQELVEDPAWSPPDSPEGPLDVISVEDVRAALATLDPVSQQMFELACFEGLPYREIAARFKIAAATVGTRLLRTRAKLRRLLHEVFEKRVGGLPAGAEDLMRITAPIALRSGAQRHIVRARIQPRSDARASAFKPASRKRSGDTAEVGPAGRRRDRPACSGSTFSGNKAASQR